jgi:protein-tyrosine phosphatase
MEKKTVKILFVCFGNICRSPTAAGVFKKIVKQEGLDDHIEVDSAGTSGYHIGDSADPRSIDAASKRGIDITDHRGRRVEEADFDKYHYIIAMDNENYSNLATLCTAGNWGKLKMFLDYSNEFEGREVPDPYYGGETGFEVVLDMVESASKGLIKEIKDTVLVSTNA